MAEKTAGDVVLLGQAGWSSAEINAQVKRLTGSVQFDDGEQSRKLLAYLVSKAMAGLVPEAADVAIELGRRAFDTRDAFVRTATSRLRERTEKYYARAAKDEIRFEIRHGSYIVFASRNPATSEAGAMLASISEPSDQADVYALVTIRGQIAALDPDLRLWLVVLAPDDFFYPQCRVSGRSASWHYDIRIARRAWGESDGMVFRVLLVSAGVDGDFEFQAYVRRGGDGYGGRLPSDVKTLDSITVIRRDIRPGGPTSDIFPPNPPPL